MRFVALAAILVAGALSLAMLFGCCSPDDAVKTKIVYVDRVVEVPTLVEVEVEKIVYVDRPAITPPKLNPPKKAPCSALCSCGCVAGGVCRCVELSATVNASRPSVTSSGCYIDANGRQVCPLKR